MNQKKTMLNREDRFRKPHTLIFTTFIWNSRKGNILVIESISMILGARSGGGDWLQRSTRQLSKVIEKFCIFFWPHGLLELRSLIRDWIHKLKYYVASKNNGAQAGSKTAGRNLRYADDTTLMAGSEEELKRFLMKVKSESENAGLKLNIQKTKIMASSPITSWQINGGKKETVTDFIFLGYKITADGDCSHEFKRCLLLGRKAMTNPDSILKSRDITLPTKVCLVKAKVFLVVMYGCGSWTINKAECWRIDAFELWCWRTLESPLDSKEIKQVNSKGNQSWIFIGRTDGEAEALILWLPDGDNWPTGKDTDAGKDWRREGKGTTEDEMMRWHHRLNGHEFEQAPGVGDGQGSQACCNPWGCKELDMTERLNWTEVNKNEKALSLSTKIWDKIRMSTLTFI